MGIEDLCGWRQVDCAILTSGKLLKTNNTLKFGRVGSQENENTSVTFHFEQNTNWSRFERDKSHELH